MSPRSHAGSIISGWLDRSRVSRMTADTRRTSRLASVRYKLVYVSRRIADAHSVNQFPTPPDKSYYDFWEPCRVPRLHVQLPQVEGTGTGYRLSFRLSLATGETRVSRIDALR